MDISSDLNEISHEKIWTWVKKGNLKRETEIFLIAAQNNAIQSNYVKAKMHEMEQNNKSRLCWDKD